MTLEEIKQEAEKDKNCSTEILNTKVLKLIAEGVPFLGCVAFVEVNQQLSLFDARQKTMDLPAFDAQRTRLLEARQVMLDDFEEED